MPLLLAGQVRERCSFVGVRGPRFTYPLGSFQPYLLWFGCSWTSVLWKLLLLFLFETYILGLYGPFPWPQSSWARLFLRVWEQKNVEFRNSESWISKFCENKMSFDIRKWMFTLGNTWISKFKKTTLRFECSRKVKFLNSFRNCKNVEFRNPEKFEFRNMES